MKNLEIVDNVRNNSKYNGKICIWNDKKEKWNSWEASLNIRVEYDASYLDLNLFACGENKDEALTELNKHYEFIFNKFKDEFVK